MRLQEKKYPRMHTVIYAVRVLVPKSYENERPSLEGRNLKEGRE